MSFDITKIEKSEKTLEIKKINTNKKGVIYFISIIIVLLIIISFSNPDTILFTIITSIVITISSLIFIFHKYRTIIDLNLNSITIEKRFLISKKITFSLSELIDYKIKDGEAGILLYIIKGIKTDLFTKQEKKYTIYRGKNIEEVKKVLETVKNFVSRETF